jgi:uncharacterized protein (TIGR03083 family)
MEYLEQCDQLEIEIDDFASTLEVAPLATRVPSCPAWSIEDLTLHLGTIHRWAEHLVRVKAQAYQPSDSLNVDPQALNPDWIRDGGAALLATLRASDPNQSMWSWGQDQHARFWSRRQLHETLVHRMDLDLALGRVPTADASVAVDSIDEFLVNLKAAARFSPSVRELHGEGEVLEVKTTDADGQWYISFSPNGFELTNETPAPTASLRGAATDLLLVLYRRVPLTSTQVSGSGSRDLIDFWIAHSALE